VSLGNDKAKQYRNQANDLELEAELQQLRNIVMNWRRY
jgi:hypothetical protein